MTNDTAFERECDAARDRWEKLAGEEIAEVIDNLGDGKDVIEMMLHLAKRNYESDAYEVLNSLHVVAGKPDAAQEWREVIGTTNPILLDLFDRYAKKAVESLKLDEAWIEGEADAVLNFPDNGSDRAWDEARDEGRI